MRDQISFNPDINECLAATDNACSDICVNEDYSYACSCFTGTSLAQDGMNCGGKSTFNYYCLCLAISDKYGYVARQIVFICAT